MSFFFLLEHFCERSFLFKSYRKFLTLGLSKTYRNEKNSISSALFPIFATKRAKSRAYQYRVVSNEN